MLSWLHRCVSPKNTQKLDPHLRKQKSEKLVDFFPGKIDRGKIANKANSIQSPRLPWSLLRPLTPERPLVHDQCRKAYSCLNRQVFAVGLIYLKHFLIAGFALLLWA